MPVSLFIHVNKVLIVNGASFNFKKPLYND